MKVHPALLRVAVAAVLAGTCLSFGVFHRDALVRAQQNSGPSQDRATLLRTNIRDGFTLASVGDLMSERPIAQDPSSEPVAQILRAADVATANCETSIVDIREHRLFGGGQISEPAIAKDFKAMGIGLVSRANNHSFDWGVDGMQETDHWLDEADIQHAGSGATRALARSAQFYDTSKGRIAMVSITSSFAPDNVAANPSADSEVPGRYGLSALRTTRYTIVTADEMQALRKIYDEHDPALGLAAPVPLPPDELRLFGVPIRVGDKPSATYKINPDDEREFLQSIRNGKEYSDFMVATMHTHQEAECAGPSAGRAWKCEKTADFVEKIAHDAIDAGADAWVGHGPHLLLGIEIYKGKPIFYSLGNFTFQEELVDRGRIGQAGAEIHGSPDPTLQATEAEISNNFWAYRHTDQRLFESVIAVSRYDKNRLTEVRLYPIDLGWSQRPAERGTPSLASSEMAQTILQHLQKMSTQYGTTIKIENNVGVIRIVSQPNAPNQQ